MGLSLASSSDIVIISDIDELPRPSSIIAFDPSQTELAFVQTLHFLNNLNRLKMTDDGKYPETHCKIKITTVGYLR